VYKGYSGVHKLNFRTAKVCLLVISAKIFYNWRSIHQRAMLTERFSRMTVTLI
jgi:hypothetical protein